MATTTVLQQAITPFTRIIGKPKGKDMFRFENECKEKSMLIADKKYGTYGSLGMIVDHDELEEKIGHQVERWGRPEPPGGDPEMRMGESDRAYEVRAKAHKKKVEYYDYFMTGEMTMRTHAFAAFDPTFTQPLKKQYPNMSEITMRIFLDHMKDKYGGYTGQEIIENLARLDEKWDGRGPIQELINKFEDVWETSVHAGDPLPNILIIAKLLEAVQDVREFDVAVKEIRMTHTREWNWTEIVAKLDLADTAREQSTMADKGYQAANAANGEANAAEDPKKKRGRTTNTSNSNTNGNGKRTVEINKHEAIASWCHSCAYIFDRAKMHGSSSCKHQKPGHDKSATIMNQKDSPNQGVTIPGYWNKAVRDE
jgi:hypothetical protein